MKIFKTTTSFPVVLILILGISTIVHSCVYDSKYDDEAIWRYKDPMNTRQLVSDSYLSKSSRSRGSYFLVGGSFGHHESMEKEIWVEMFVEVDSAFMYVKTPIQRVKIHLTEDTQPPYIQLTYKYREEITAEELIHQLEYANWYNTYVNIYCPEKYLPETLIPINLNDHEVNDHK